MAIYKYETKKNGVQYMVRYRNKSKRGFKSRKDALRYEEIKKKKTKRAKELYKQYFKTEERNDERREHKE